MVKKGAGSATPNKKSMEILRKLDYQPWLVQSRITPMVSLDLFNIIDVLAYGHNQILGVQATSRGQRTQHINKMVECEHLQPLIENGMIVELWCFWQRKGASRLYFSRERFNMDLSIDVLYYGLASKVTDGIN